MRCGVIVNLINIYCSGVSQGWAKMRIEENKSGLFLENFGKSIRKIDMKQFSKKYYIKKIYISINKQIN